jgi:hypothetical protein
MNEQELFVALISYKVLTTTAISFLTITPKQGWTIVAQRQEQPLNFRQDGGVIVWDGIQWLAFLNPIMNCTTTTAHFIDQPNTNFLRNVLYHPVTFRVHSNWSPSIYTSSGSA